jgi:hypothetical protein
MSVEVDPFNAASDIELQVTVDKDGNAVLGKFSFSVIRYADAVLGGEASETEKELISDVLAYVRSAYVYFIGEDDAAEDIAKIDAVLGSYTKTFEKVSAATDTGASLKAATFILEATPKIRFYIAKGCVKNGFVFTAGGKAIPDADISFSVATYQNEQYDVVDISLYAYRMISEISYTYGSESGSYHINSYYDFVVGDSYTGSDKADLTKLVECFYNYCKSAEAYRASVTNN